MMVLAAVPGGEELVLFGILLIGCLLGKLKLAGFQLGSAGIIFTALTAGHYGWTIPQGVGTLGMVLFVFCLGVGAGPGFFRTLGSQGMSLVCLAAAMISAAAVAAWGMARVASLPGDLATGLFAGALTSTPALATVSDFLPPDSQLTVGFGIAYPLGTLLVILFVQAYPRLFPDPRDHRTTSLVTGNEGESSRIVRRFVKVLNPGLVGKSLEGIPLLDESNCQVSRVLVGDIYCPIPSGFTLQLNQQLLLVGEEHDTRALIDMFGQEIEALPQSLHIGEQQRRRVVVTARDMVGKSLKQLQLRTRLGVTISRIRRHDVEFVPDAREELHPGDAVTAIGEPEALDRFMVQAGHRERSYHETDLVSLFTGLVVGLLLGSLEFRFNGEGFSLGKAGGPLIVGLLLGHFGRIGPITGHYPAAVRLLLTELGLALFLADSGVQAGREFLPVLQQHGLFLLLAGVVITAVPLLTGWLVGQRFLKLPRQPLLGGICGAMTSTPGLGALMMGDDANTAVRSYASIYPLALILMSVLTPMLLAVLSWV